MYGGTAPAVIGTGASVLGTQFLPSGPVGEVGRAALAVTGVACGTYLVFACALIVLGVLLRHWGAAKEESR